MTDRTELLERHYTRNLNDAVTALDAGFSCKARQKAALDNVNRAYSHLADKARDVIRANAPGSNGTLHELTAEIHAARMDYFKKFDTPFDLHHVRPKHAEALGAQWAAVEMLVQLRKTIKETPIVAKVPDAAKVELAKIQKKITESVVDMMKRRNQQYVEGLKLHDIFNGLPVSVSSHWVHNPKGDDFIRHFYYINGEFTALAVILAIMDTKAREAEEKSKA